MPPVNGPKFTMAIKYWEYVDAIEQGEVWSRSDFIAAMGKSYSTVRYHLGKAVEAGALHCQIGMVSDDKVGWLYALPETMPRLPFEESERMVESAPADAPEWM